MIRPIVIIAVLILSSLLLFGAGCEKERIVESTEYIHEIEYIEAPADTVFQIDTVYSNESPVIQIDTVIVSDTIIEVNNVYDTVLVHDTVVNVQYVYDTVITIEQHFDTTVVTDTVLTIQCDPNEHTAIGAMEYYCDPLVLDFVYSEFGISGGYIFYLSSLQIEITQPGSGVWDIYGYIDYWTTDLTGYSLIEYYWRMTHTGGDPGDPSNWQISEPPVGSSGRQPGIKLAPDAMQIERTRR